MPDPLKFIYSFELQGGKSNRFEILLQRGTLALISEEKDNLPDWTKLKFHQCSNCPLKKRKNKHCPTTGT